MLLTLNNRGDLVNHLTLQDVVKIRIHRSHFSWEIGRKNEAQHNDHSFRATYPLQADYLSFRGSVFPEERP
jgi:hypothetical protein